MNKIILSFLLFFSFTAFSQKSKSYELKSPDGKLVISVATTPNLTWSIRHENTTVLLPSPVSLSLKGGEVLGDAPVIAASKTTSVNNIIKTPIYKKKEIPDQYNSLQLSFKKGFGVVFRAYNDGAAYRFVTSRKDSLVIEKEETAFNFDDDYNSFIPYVRDPRYDNDKFQTSFENLYTEKKLSQFANDTLGFLPILIELKDGKKVVILEADMEDYPGIYVALNSNASNSLKAVHAPCPLTEKLGGNAGGRNSIVTSRENFIARTKGARSFPWRAVIVSTTDKDLLNNDMVYKLAAPSQLADASWVKPGKVAWDWWNDWNISGVDFKAGINTPTYKYYIDFAAANKLEYIVMDEGWSLNTDIGQISPAINLEEIVTYGKQKGVGVILWATWYALRDRLDEIFSKYSKMGIKGFKIDFFDRDDQKLVASTYDIARIAANYQLMVDLHGFYKPTGLQRTYSNVIGFEGVRGMENVKWATSDDVPRYDVSLPFIRMVAGPMDYTPGAMRNATKEAFRPINSMPMSQGTRCHQLAMYVIYEAPLGMLSDNPTAYMREQESTNFIAKIPTVFDETVALEGKVGQYAALARRSGNTWYAAAMTNWTPRDVTIDFSFLDDGTYEAEVFRDGINADRDATDHKREIITVMKGEKKTFRLMNGGGFAARIYPKR